MGYRRRILWGAGLGVVLAAAVLAWGPAAHRGGEPGVILSECQGPLREMVIQYESGALEDIAPVYREFLGQLDADVTVHAVCPDRAAFDQLRGVVGPTRCRVTPVLTGHAQTSWARDRWVALACPDGSARLVCPAHETAGGAWPQRAGDERIAENLASSVPGVRCQRSDLYFDGGDVLATPRHAILTTRVLPRNVARTVQDSPELTRRMESLLGRPALLLETAPDHHAAMFMMSAGQDVMLVGDPSMAKACCSTAAPAVASLPDGADFSAQTQGLFDAVAEQCRQAGHRVVRIPVVPGRDGRTYLTYVNVLIDFPPGRPLVYMPTYRGAEPLNDAAAAVWRGLGYEVRPIDCTNVYRHFGCLHCLVNVLRRG